MPIPTFRTDQPAAVCCESWFTLVENLVLVAGGAVADCLGGACPQLQVYVSHGEPIGGGDYVVAWLAGVGVRNLNANAPTYGAVGAQLSIGVSVCLTNYPGMRWEGGKLTVVPGASEYMHASYYTYGVAERMWRAVANESVKKPGTVFGACSSVQVGDLAPQQPVDYSARWGMTVRVAL